MQITIGDNVTIVLSAYILCQNVSAMSILNYTKRDEDAMTVDGKCCFSRSYYMKVLVINGDCIETNSSANLCHLSYIRGLLDIGAEVELLSADGKSYKKDSSMNVPQQVVQHSYDGMSLYQLISQKRRRAVDKASVQDISTQSHTTQKEGITRKLKDLALSLYGVHGIYQTFLRRGRQFHSLEPYDYILSISTPPSSHRLAYYLLASKRVHAKHWIQIWEDPWYCDAYGFSRKEKILREEKRLLSFAEKVCYVSPLTLRNQQRLFPESAQKMFWMPLPTYYKTENQILGTTGKNTYGYFGDYSPMARDLAPFYETAKKSGIETYICGSPSNLFPSTEHIHISPRLPLAELKPIEDKTNVLVFLCNRKGGQIPGKIYQYSATEKTILFVLDGTEEEQSVLREYFGQFNRYIFCRNTAEDIARAIKKIESGDLSDVENRPLDNFEPAKIITGILEAVK